jgi:hypothetical protein
MRLAAVTTIKIVALPAEHGASVMLGESLLAGLLIAVSGHGFLPALGWVFLFLMSNPLKIAIKDISRHVFTARTSVALWFCTGFGILALGFFLATFYYSGPSFLLILIGVIPLGMIHLWAVVNAGKKEFIAELFGALTLGAAAASIILAAGHFYVQAMTVWAILAIRAGTSVVYVRHRLNQTRGKGYNLALLILIHTLGIAFLGGLVIAHLAKPIILIAGFLLTLRLLFVLNKSSVSPVLLGVQESILGIIFVILIVVGI